MNVHVKKECVQPKYESHRVVMSSCHNQETHNTEFSRREKFEEDQNKSQIAQVIQFAPGLLVHIAFGM